MNKKGFTLVELLATLVILAIVMGIVLASGIFNLENAKGKTEDVFIDSIKDAMKIYLDSDAKKLSYNEEVCSIDKTHKLGVKIYKANDITFDDVINSTYKPMTVSDLVNPNNEDVTCNVYAKVSVYRDEDYVYYYKIEKDDFDCLKSSGVISNLPEGCLN